MLQQMKEELVSSSENITRIANYFHTHKTEIERVAESFGKINVNRAIVTDGAIDVYVTGDKHMLAACFVAFRKAGYQPGSRPGPEKTSSFSCYWDHDTNKCRFWLSFSSDKCTRVKVGTEMVQRDIYETVCE
jgi:hypothetical protein